MASEGDVRAAISKIKHSPSSASKRDYELAEQAAKQAGSLGNDARAALQGK